MRSTSSSTLSDPPPPYRDDPEYSSFISQSDEKQIEEKSTPPPNPIPYIKRSDKEQLRRYLIEILVFQFDADISQHHAALGNDREACNLKTSILSDKEKSDLLELATLIQRIHKHAATNCWNTTTDAERKMLKSSVLKGASRDFTYYPAHGLIMDLVSTYADHQCQVDLRHKTLLKYWQKEERFYQKDQKYQLKYCLQAHATLNGDICLNESVRLVLGKAQEKYQQELRFTDVESTRHFYGARKAYKALAEMLAFDSF